MVSADSSVVGVVEAADLGEDSEEAVGLAADSEALVGDVATSEDSIRVNRTELSSGSAATPRLTRSHLR
jgi:hypothetical protein